jgi:hypothetical protein
LIRGEGLGIESSRVEIYLMIASERKAVVQDFCEREFVDWYKSGSRFVNWRTDLCQDFLIASLELLEEGTSGGFDCVEIKRIQQDTPKSVSDTFDRHFWYSQHSLSDLYLLKIPIEEKPAFVLLIRGLLDDGWDNSGSWIEVLDEQGEFLGSGRFRDQAIIWQERPLNGEDFKTPAPPWINDEIELQVTRPKWADEVNPMWTEEILTQHAARIENEGTKVRYIMLTE